MLDLLIRLFNDRPFGLRRKVGGLYALLIAFNIGAWCWALVVFHAQPVLLGTALLAYTFGLRHAVDADHIAAIDNVTRKLMHEGHMPIGAGLFFSLGHSAMVLAMSIGVAVGTRALQSRWDAFKSLGGLIGTSVSAMFLLVLAMANLLILVSAWRTFRAVQAGETLVQENLDLLLNRQGGLLARLFRSLFGLVSRSWHLFPIGMLFGLGFDTATEVALLGISATQAAQGISLWSVLVLPVLFTAGMSLLDTTDGILMLGVYRWTFVKPIRKIYYNLTITSISVLVALLVGGIEALGLLATRAGLDGPVWRTIGALNENFGTIGYVVIGTFVFSWLASLAIYRIKGYDEIEVTVRGAP